MDLLAGLSAEDRRQVLAAGRHRRFAAGEVLFHQGDPADSFFLVERGRVAVRASTPMGESVTLVVIGRGEVVGELALLEDGGRRSATVAALELTEVWSFQREVFHELRRTCPGANEFLLRTLAADVRRLSGLLLDALYLPVRTRVLRRLADLETQYRTGTPPTAIPLTQDRVASLAGASRVAVNQVLRAAAADGIVELRRGKIIILDPDALRRAGRSADVGDR